PRPTGFNPLPQMVPPPPPRFQFTIDPKTPLKDLLPAVPKLKSTGGPVLSEDLTLIPEVAFQASPGKNVEAAKDTAYTLAKINHKINPTNAKKAEASREAPLGKRPNRKGPPMAMGDPCRIKGERNKQFAIAVNTVRRAMQFPRGAAVPAPAAPATAPAFRSSS